MEEEQKVYNEEDIKLYQALTEDGTKIQHICYDPEDLDLSLIHI